ncbi:MAG: hypothetical protein EA001_16025 [Oscillatoriales cyanobacterium]|nr:MAG: hypothetical protein EA001_16025 [Oscillatoriales cyanobacterium]
MRFPFRSWLLPFRRSTSRLAFGLLATLAVLGAIALAVAPSQARSAVNLPWVELSGERSAGISGLVWQAAEPNSDPGGGFGRQGEAQAHGDRFLAVHDTKSDPALFKRLSRLQWNDRHSWGMFSLTWPAAAELPNDLEAISAIPGARDYVAVTSRGRAYRLAIPAANSTIGDVFFTSDPRSLEQEPTVRAVFDLPATPEPNCDIETLQITRLGDRLVVLFADRGGDRRPATLHWGWFDPATNAIALQGSTPITGPLDPKLQRSLADVVVLPDGRLLGAAAIDRGDNGPFQSTLYWLGRLQLVQNQLVWQPTAQGRSLVNAGNHKIEALALAPAGNPTRLAIATDDENLGLAVTQIPLDRLLP